MWYLAFLASLGLVLCGPFLRFLQDVELRSHLLSVTASFTRSLRQHLWSGWRSRGEFSPGHMLGNVVSYVWERLVPCQLSGCFCTKSLWPIKSPWGIAARLWLGSLFLSQSQRVQTRKRPAYVDLAQWSRDVPLAYTGGSQSLVNKVSEFCIRRIKDYFQVNVTFRQLHSDVFSCLVSKQRCHSRSLRVSVTVSCACEQYLPWRHGGIKVEKLVTLSWWLSHTHWPAGQGQGSAAVLATPLPSTWGCGLRDLRGSLWFWTFTGVASSKGYLPLNLCLWAIGLEKWLHWFWGGLQTIYANSVFWRRSH